MDLIYFFNHLAENSFVLIHIPTECIFACLAFSRPQHILLYFYNILPLLVVFLCSQATKESMLNLNGSHTPFSRQLTNQILRWICGIYFKNLNPHYAVRNNSNLFVSHICFQALYLPKHSTTAIAYIVFVHLISATTF